MTHLKTHSIIKQLRGPGVKLESFYMTKQAKKQKGKTALLGRTLCSDAKVIVLFPENTHFG